MGAKSCSGRPNISGPPASTVSAVSKVPAQATGDLGALSLDDTLNFVRGFMLFSLLANLAEDRQGLAHEEGATVAEAFARLKSGRVDGPDATCSPCCRNSLIVPVLTAHPTEVRRKSIIDHKNRIASADGDAR